MTLRLHVPMPLPAGATVVLPPGPSRHAQVRRVQPGDTLLLFDGSGAEWPAQVTAMGRSDVTVRLGTATAPDRELRCKVTLALGMPANDRMDALVEKATELGVSCVQPLVCTRSVLRLDGERALRKQAHWQAIAVAACEQSGRTRVPRVAPVLAFADWLASAPAARGGQPPGQASGASDDVLALLLSPGTGAAPLPEAAGLSVCALSGPEGGLSPLEEQAALAAGFVATGLGPRVLRADTAPLVVLAWAGLRGG